MSNNPKAEKDWQGTGRPGFMRLGRDGKFSIQIYPPKSFTGRPPPVGNAWTMIGSYKVSEKPAALELRVTQSTFPNIGPGLERRQVKLAGDRLIMTNPRPPKGWSANWIWSRAAK
jgi:hypothetical protein